MGLGRAGAYHWSVARAGISLIRREAHPSRAYVTAGLELKMAQKFLKFWQKRVRWGDSVTSEIAE